MHSYVFLRAFSGAVFSCFLSCFFWCLLVILLVVFFVLFLVLFSLCSGAFFRAFFRACPFSFLYTFPLGGGPVFCRAFFRGFWVFFPCFFSCFLRCFFCVFYRAFFRVFFRSFSRIFFRVVFFRALGGTRDKQPQYFAFWPVLFSVLFLVVTTSEDRIYTIYRHVCALLSYIRCSATCGGSRLVFLIWNFVKKLYINIDMFVLFCHISGAAQRVEEADWGFLFAIL